MALTQEERQNRATQCREAAEQIESCWRADSLGAAQDFIDGNPKVANHLGALDPPRWMKPLLTSDPQTCVSRLLREADRYDPLPMDEIIHDFSA